MSKRLNRSGLNFLWDLTWSQETLLYAESISAWSNQGSVMCLLSILDQKKKYGGNIYLSIYLIIQLWAMNPPIGAVSKWKYLLLLKLWWKVLWMVKVEQRKWVFATNPNFLTPIHLQPNDVNLWYFKLILFDITEVIVWNI